MAIERSHRKSPKIKAVLHHFLLTLLLAAPLLGVGSVWAVDADGDGHTAEEEALAGTSDADPNNRPYWWKTYYGTYSYGNIGYGSPGFGRSVSGAGDVNNDGYPDIIMGDYSNQDSESVGAAYVISGFDGSTLYTLVSGVTNDRYGESVSDAGDVNKDGYDDVIVGAYSDSVNGYLAGAAYVYSGVDGSLIHTMLGAEGGEWLGFAVSGGGDVNNDGYPDLIVGSYNEDKVQVFSGLDGSLIHHLMSGAQSRFGEFVDDAGDVNNDGYADVIAGGIYGGATIVFSGVDGSVLHSLAENSLDVANAGDINNDGYGDFMVGTWWSGPIGWEGQVKVFSGIDGALSQLTGYRYDDGYGRAIDNVGDINNDGYVDLIISSNRSHDISDTTVRGQVEIVSGADFSTLYRFDGVNDGDQFGSAVSGIGDIDGDNRGDFVISIRGDDTKGTNTGAVRVYRSSDLQNDSDMDFYINAADAFPVDPNEWIDSDGDGTGDNGDNCPVKSNPNQLDTDQDGLGNSCDDDDDGDGMPDSWENTYGFNRLDNSDAAQDADGDGYSNLQEYLSGTDPTVADIPTKNDFLNTDVAGWIWKGEGNGFEGKSRIWTPDWSQASPGWIPPIRTWPPDWDQSLAWDIQTTGDFDGDGDADWLWRNKTTKGWRVWEIENGYRVGVYGPLTDGFDEAHEWVVAGAGDTDKDGDDDVILNKTSTGDVIIWEMDDHRQTAEHAIGTFAGYTATRAGDFDGDGDMDIQFQQQGGNLLRFWEIEDHAMVQLYTTPETGAGFTTQCTGDFNNDGNDDVYLLAANGTSKWFEYVDFVRQRQVFGVNQSSWEFLGCGDYDGDGDTDILWSSSDGLGLNRLFINENFNNAATYYMNRFGGSDPSNPAYGFEYRGNGN